MKKILILIVILAAFLRIYNLDTVPPSLSWDETAVGYNAFTIANYGKDEYGNFLPAYFRSFGEDKQPIHIYITAIFVKFLGLNEFSVRLPAAIFGLLNIVIIFYLVREIFKNETAAILSSFFLAISPQNIFFSRFNHEANFALFFFMLGLLLFYKSINRRGDLLPFSVLSFFISVISYNAAKIIVPIIVVFLTVLYFKKIIKDKVSLVFTFFITMCLSVFILLNLNLLGINRFNQTKQGNINTEETEIFKKTGNYLLGRIGLSITQYSWHFDPDYLFNRGANNSRLSVPDSGQFLKIDLLFLIFGVAYFLYKRSREGFLLLLWAVVAPLPSALFAEAPHVGRASFMMGGWNIIAAFGLFYILLLVRKKGLKMAVLGSSFIIAIFFLFTYLNYYFNDFPKRYAIDWQYGMKQVAEYVKEHDEYEQVYMTDVRVQPYIFFLFYLKTPLPDYLNTMILNNSQSSSYNNVSYFEKYSFGGWDPIESMPNKGVLYVLSPSEYDGLRQRNQFEVKKLILYPNGTSAFYLVSVN